MSISVYVALLSGQSLRISADLDSTVDELQRLAQDMSGLRLAGLVAAGGLLPVAKTLADAGLQEGDTLQGVALPSDQLASTTGAFALLRADGSVVTWGDDDLGGDCSGVRDQLQGVKKIYATDYSFAALLSDGSVVTWGNPLCGGRIRPPALQGVCEITGSAASFAALREDGSVTTWGGAFAGGDSSGVQAQLQGVVQICASYGAFAAVLETGAVVTWGDPYSGGESSEVRSKLQDVKSLRATHRAFAAILRCGSVVTWGSRTEGGDSSSVQDQLVGVSQLEASNAAFAAILQDGSVLAWGSADHGGDTSSVQGQLHNVQKIAATGYAFAAMMDGSLVTWGNAGNGGDSRAVQPKLRPSVRKLAASVGAFAAILEDGRVVTWGNAERGADSSKVQRLLRNVEQIQASYGAFAAILSTGSVITWGNDLFGADSRSVAEELRNARQNRFRRLSRTILLPQFGLLNSGSKRRDAPAPLGRRPLRCGWQPRSAMGIISSCCSHDASVEAEENKSTMKKEPSPTKADATEMAVPPAASREKERMMVEKSAKVTASGSEYEITLDKSTGKRLGIDVDHKDGKTLLIECINEGLVKDWNDAAPDETKVQINDRITEPRHGGEAWALVVAADPVAELSAAVLHAGLRAEVVAPATALSCIGRLPGRLAVVLAQSPEKDFLRTLRRGHDQVFTIAMDEAFAHCPASRLAAFDAGARMVTSSVAAVKEALAKVSAVFSSAGPFACTACGLGPLSENALHLHMHFHHAVDAVPEDSCPICAERPSNLAVHLHNSHGPPAEREPPPAPYATFAWCVCRRLDGRFLLVNEPSGIAGGRPNFWLPAGRVDRGESLQEACRREALEEAGISVKVTGLLRLMVDSHQTLRAVFLAEPEDDAHAEPKSVPDWESVGAMWAEVADIQKLKESDFRNPDPQELYPKVASGSLKPQPVDTKEFVALEALIRRLTAGDRKAQRELEGVWRSVQAAYPAAAEETLTRQRCDRGTRQRSQCKEVYDKPHFTGEPWKHTPVDEPNDLGTLATTSASARKALPRCCHMPDSRKAKSRPPGRRGAAVSAEASLTEKVFGWKAGFSRWRLHSVNQLLVKLLCRGVGLSASAFRYTATVQRMSYVAVPRSRERNQEELKPEVQSSLTPCLTWGQTREWCPRGSCPACGPVPERPGVDHQSAASIATCWYGCVVIMRPPTWSQEPMQSFRVIWHDVKSHSQQKTKESLT
eukprot:s1093_g5.t1